MTPTPTLHAFASSRLDYCNGFLFGIPSKSINKLQYIQNCAARILMRVRKYNQITPILKTLHWLPVGPRIDYKISLLTCQCVYGNAQPTERSFLSPRSSHGPSAPLQPTSLRSREPSWIAWVIEPSAHLLPGCGIHSPTICDHHRLWILLNVVWKLNFLRRLSPSLFLYILCCFINYVFTWGFMWSSSTLRLS